jgi:hypothetical protein
LTLRHVAPSRTETDFTKDIGLPKDHFYYKRQRYEVIDRVFLGGKQFLIASQLSAGTRRRYQAFDPLAGPYGALRILQFMPRTTESWKRVDCDQEVSHYCGLVGVAGFLRIVV